MSIAARTTSCCHKISHVSSMHHSLVDICLSVCWLDSTFFSSPLCCTVLHWILTRRVLFRIAPVVEFRQLDRVDLNEFPKLKVQNDLFVGIGLAAECGVPDQQVRPWKPGVFVAGVAGRLVQLFGEVDGFWEDTGSCCRSGSGDGGNGSHGDLFCFCCDGMSLATNNEK